MNLVRSAFVAALLAAPVAASAGPRIVLAHVGGDRGGVLSRQLAVALCDRFECVPRSKAYAGRRPDFAKARRNGVSAIVFGALTGNAPNRMLWLALLTTSTEPDRSWSLPVRERGLLAARSVEALVRDLERRLAPPRSAPRPGVLEPAPPPPAPAPAAPADAAASVPPPAPPRVPPSSPTSTAEPPSAPRPDAIAAAPPRPAPAPVPPPRVPPPPPARPPPARARTDAASPRWGAVELGAWVTGRDLTYAGTDPPGTGTLQTMQVDAVVCPRAYLELYPAAGLGGPLAGLGVFADYRRSVGFEVLAGSEKHSAQLGRLAAGLTWRLPPLSGWRLSLAPAVSYERLDVTVSGAIPGLPDAHLAGVKIGSRLAVPLGARYALLLGAGWVLWTSAGDLVAGEGGFFPSGDASAIEVEAGVSVALSGPFSARLVGEYASTRYSLDADATGTYRASRATDRYAGGRAAIRAEF